MKKSTKKAMAVISAFIMTFSSIPAIPIFAANNPDDLVNTAANEIGYKQGADGYTKFGAYTGYTYEAWCMSFVAWCGKEAGIPSSAMKRSASCTVEGNWFKDNNAWHNSAYNGGNYIPQKGDIIFFRWSGKKSGKLDHVGIVEYVDDNSVHTIEGNSNYRVKRNTYSLGSSVIAGYGTPFYDGSYSDEQYVDSSSAETWRVTTQGGCLLRSSASSSSSVVNYHFINGKTFTVTEKVYVGGDIWGYTQSDGCGWINLRWCTLISGGSDVNYTTNDSNITTSTPVSIESAVYYLSPKCAPNSCIDAEGGEYLYDGYNDNIHLWEYLGNLNQQFLLEFAYNKENENYYTLQNRLTGKYLIMNIGGDNNVLESEYSMRNAKWRFVEYNGYYQLINEATGLALDINGAYSDNGTNAQGWDSSVLDNSAQLFSLHKVDGTYGSDSETSFSYYTYQTTTDLTVRSEPSIYGSKLGVLKKGTKVYTDYSITDDRGVSWWHINYNSRDAYVSGSYLSYLNTVYN